MSYWILLCNVGIFASGLYLIKCLHLNEHCKLRGPEKAFNFSRPFKWRLNLDVLAKAKEGSMKFLSDNLIERYK